MKKKGVRQQWQLKYFKFLFTDKKQSRNLENTKLPFIIFLYCRTGGVAYGDIDFGSEWNWQA
jgi:hypothetical protein